MARVPVSAKTLNALGDGYAGKAIDKALDEINRDLVDRGADGKKRKLTVTFTFSPSDEGRRVAIDVSTKPTLPAWVPPETHAKYDSAAGGFMFQPEAAGDPEQMVLGDLDGDGE